jgi:hypothetical protein
MRGQPLASVNPLLLSHHDAGRPSTTLCQSLRICGRQPSRRESLAGKLVYVVVSRKAYMAKDEHKSLWDPAKYSAVLAYRALFRDAT